MTILFLGTGDIGVPTLRWLLEESGHHVVGVVCQPDKPVGRHKSAVAPATKVLALDADVPVFQPERIQHAAVLDEMLATPPDLILVVAYGQFLPRRLREAARLGCFNLHASLLPRWRGASPIQSAIAAGDVETGITVMHVERDMDAGDMVVAEAIPIFPDDTGQSLHDRLALLAPRVLARALPLIERGAAPRLPQDATRVTHCAKLSRQDALLDWARPAVDLELMIRAFHPWPGTHTHLPERLGGKLLKVLPPTAVDGASSPAVSAAPGTLVAVTRESVSVATGCGTLTLNALQAEGQKCLPAREFLTGTKLQVGDRLGAR